MQKVLIIKLGHSETLDPEIGNVPSLGDVMRTTVILHCFNDHDVSWLCDEHAYALLKDNPYINRILFYNLTTVMQVQAERFDIVVNLEKIPGICALTDSISAWSKYGFRFDPLSGEVKSYEKSHEILQIYTDLEKKKNAKKIWQEVLFEMIGHKWSGEKYILGYNPGSNVDFDIGLNCLVGTKWPNKVWPKEKWTSLHEHLSKEGYNISWQQGKNNIEEYIEWINSCNLIVTHDSLGLHIAIALQKKIVALFGPTAAHETHLYNLGNNLLPETQYDCLPCLEPVCPEEIPCMNSISLGKVLSKIKKVLNK